MHMHEYDDAVLNCFLKNQLQLFPEEVAETNMCFIPSNLDYLRAGGRVSNAAAIAGNILGLKPCIEIVDGYLKATKKYRGNYNKVLPKLIQEFVEKNNLDREEIWLCNTVQFSKEMKALVEATVKENEKLSAEVKEIKEELRQCLIQYSDLLSRENLRLSFPRLIFSATM